MMDDEPQMTDDETEARDDFLVWLGVYDEPPKSAPGNTGASQCTPVSTGPKSTAAARTTDELGEPVRRFEDTFSGAEIAKQMISGIEEPTNEDINQLRSVRSGADVGPTPASASVCHPLNILFGVFVGTVLTGAVGSILTATGVNAYVPPTLLLFVWMAFTSMGIVLSRLIP